MVVEAYDDPIVNGVTCYVSRARTGGIKGTLGVAEDPSEASIACRQVGPISFKEPLKQQTDVFSERMSFIFKTLHVVRVVDTKRNTIVYLTYSDRIVSGSPKRRHRGTDAGRHDDSGQSPRLPGARAITVDSTAPAPDHVRHPPSRLRTLLAHAAAAGRGSPHGHLSRSCVRPHWHDAYTIPVILEGAERFTYRGSGYVAETGSVPVINPGEVHTGSRAADEGWCYRVSYMPVEFIRELTCSIAGRPQDAPWFAPDVIRDADLAARLTLAHRMMEAGSERALPLQTHGQPAHDPTTGAPRVYDPLAAETAMLDALSTLIVRHADAPRPAPLAADEPRVDVMRGGSPPTSCAR